MTDQYSIKGNPEYRVDNEGNPYSAEDTSISRGEPYTTDLAGRSTMVSNSVEMTKRLKAYVPKMSAKEGYASLPTQGYDTSSEEENRGSNYEAKYQ